MNLSNTFTICEAETDTFWLLQFPPRFRCLPCWVACSLALEEVEWSDSRNNDYCESQSSGGQWCQIGGSNGRLCAAKMGARADLSFRVRCSRYSHYTQQKKVISRPDKGLRVLGKHTLQYLQMRPPIKLSWTPTISSQVS